MTDQLRFRTVEAAWLWTMAELLRRRDGGKRPAGPYPAVDPADVMQCLDALYRRHRVDCTHARVLRMFGERGHAPDQRREAAEHKIWTEAMEQLDWPLRANGIVVGDNISECV